jgi:hypothetical protein
MPPLLPLDANHSAIGHLLVGSTVEGDLRRKAGRRVVPDEPNAGDRLAPWPLPDRLEAFLSQGVIGDCSSKELDHVARKPVCRPYPRS